LYPTYHSKELVSALTAVGADVTYCDLQSTWGHDAFLLEVDTMTRLISDFLGRVVREHNISNSVCHAEHSEASRFRDNEMLRSAQHDKVG
jgi:homoserine O-acetyltransferase